MKQAESSSNPEEPPQEMGELVESDQELYWPDDEDDYMLNKLLGNLQGKLQRGGHDNEANVPSEQKKHDKALAEVLSDDSDASLQPAEESAAQRKERKAHEAAFNNSYTGPYPLDPTEFLHTDKGANAQFVHYNRT